MIHAYRLATVLTSSLLLVALLVAISESSFAAPKVKWIKTQYIAALGDPSATRGNNAEEWGIWVLDPGPRGVRLTESAQFLAKGEAPVGWRLNRADWWLEEYGRIMEAPEFPIAPGEYVVSNGQSMIGLLTVKPKDASGHMAWELAHGATLISVTHLGCRAGRYRPESAGAVCTPGNAAPEQFPVKPGATMPAVKHCAKQDYHVLLVIGVVDQRS
ncbi:MAG: hypothetical protein ACKVP5_21250 [Aestuariivirga sp.]